MPIPFIARDNALRVGPKAQHVIAAQPEQIIEGHFLAKKAYALRVKTLLRQSLDQSGTLSACWQRQSYGLAKGAQRVVVDRLAGHDLHVMASLPKSQPVAQIDALLEVPV